MSSSILINGWLDTLQFELFVLVSQVPYILYHGPKTDRAQLRLGIGIKQSLDCSSSGLAKDGAREGVKNEAGGGGGVKGALRKVAPVVITSYEIAMQDRPVLAGYSWKLLIVDEGHRIKNSNCRLIRSVMPQFFFDAL